MIIIIIKRNATSIFADDLHCTCHECKRKIPVAFGVHYLVSCIHMFMWRHFVKV